MFSGQTSDGGEATGEETNQHNEELAASVRGGRLGHTEPSSSRSANQAGAAPVLNWSKPGDLTHVEFIGGEQVKFRSIALGCSLRMHGAGESSATVPASPTVLTNLSTSEINLF